MIDVQTQAWLDQEDSNVRRSSAGMAGSSSTSVAECAPGRAVTGATTKARRSRTPWACSEWGIRNCSSSASP
jgi:hypothetical protein